MTGRDLVETWTVAVIARIVWYSAGFTASAVIWAIFILAVKLDAVIDAIYRTAPAKP